MVGVLYFDKISSQVVLITLFRFNVSLGKKLSKPFSFQVFINISLANISYFV